MVTVRQLLLSLWLVKRMSVTDRNACNRKGDETKELGNDVPQVRLVVHDVGHVE